MKRVSAKARVLVAAVAAAAAVSGVAAAQDEEEEAPLADARVCGRDFAASGAATNVVYAATQLRTCDALLMEAATAAELNAAADTIAAAHAGVLERWHVVIEELVAAASDPAAARAIPLPAAPDVEEPAAAPRDTWTMKLAERHAIETAMDGLRILMRLSYQLADSYADPSALAAALEGPAAERVSEVLEDRQVCASAGRQALPNRPALPASWLAHATLFPTSAEEEPITYEREIVDEVAGIAETYLTMGLASAPDLAVRRLRSFETKAECAVREWPSERDES